MTTLYEGAFAKLNLTLDVLGKRPDGYHDIKSVMQAISLRDDIEIDIGTGKPWKLLCDKEDIPTDERNLAWKAAKLFFDTTGKDPQGLDSSLRCPGFSLQWLLLLQSTGSRCMDFSNCNTRAQQLQLTGSRALSS